MCTAIVDVTFTYNDIWRETKKHTKDTRPHNSFEDFYWLLRRMTRVSCKERWRWQGKEKQIFPSSQALPFWPVSSSFCSLCCFPNLHIQQSQEPWRLLLLHKDDTELAAVCFQHFKPTLNKQPLIWKNCTLSVLKEMLMACFVLCKNVILDADRGFIYSSEAWYLVYWLSMSLDSSGEDRFRLFV